MPRDGMSSHARLLPQGEDATTRFQRQSIVPRFLNSGTFARAEAPGSKRSTATGSPLLLRCLRIGPKTLVTFRYAATGATRGRRSS